MSYATSNQNSENRFDIPEEFLNRTGKHLNQSLDIRECLEPVRRRANIEEAERALAGLPQVTAKDPSDVLDNFVIQIMALMPYKRQISSFINVELKTMQDVLQHNFIKSWNEMNVRQFISDSYELSGVIMDSGNVTDHVCWRVALLMRLQEKLIASMRTLDNLYRVHDAYYNTVPLQNSNVTPSGSYDAFFFTRELFKPIPEINETYIRLRKHIMKYTENINSLYHIYTSHENDIELKHESRNYSNGLMQAAEGYDRDLRIYESLVIRQPLQRIETAKTEIQELVIQGLAKHIDFETNVARTNYIYKKKYKYWLEFNQTDTTGKIAAYLHDLKNERYVSKLYIAVFLTSHRIQKLVEDNREYLSRSHELTRTLCFDLTQYLGLVCKCNHIVAHTPLMQAFYAKLYDHYTTATDSERLAMDLYFRFANFSSVVPRLIDGGITWHDCFNLSLIPPPILLNNISLQNLTSFKNGFKTFLEKTRLSGHFFRYFIAIDIL